MSNLELGSAVQSDDQNSSQSSDFTARLVEMQLINPPHQGKIAFRHRTRQIVDAATAEAEKLGLACNG